MPTASHKVECVYCFFVSWKMSACHNLSSKAISYSGCRCTKCSAVLCHMKGSLVETNALLAVLNSMFPFSYQPAQYVLHREEVEVLDTFLYQRN